MEDKKACKKILKTYKKHPEWYTPQEIQYVKMIKKSLKITQDNLPISDKND